MMLLVVLTGCPPIPYKVYIRNFSNDTVTFIKQYREKCDPLFKSIQLPSRSICLSIDHDTRAKLTEHIDAIRFQNKVSLIVPPNTTVFINDLLYTAYPCTSNAMLMNRDSNVQTLQFNYRFRGQKGIKREADKEVLPGQKTLIYYDIK
jgi:hypothetical protein